MKKKNLTRDLRRIGEVIEPRLDSLEMQVGDLIARVKTERQARLDQLTAIFEAWKKQRDALDELLRKTEQLEKSRDAWATGGKEFLDTTKALAEEQRAAFAEFRARLEDLEDWMLAAKKSCSALRSIPFPKPKAEAAIDQHAVKAAGASK